MTRERDGQTLRYDDVSVVMITRNEEGAIAAVIDDVFRELPGVEVVVVDGSTDQTPGIAAMHGARVIPEPGGGPGPALFCALNASQRPIVATIDADATYPVDAFPELIELVRAGYAVAGGDRLGNRRVETMPLANWAANKLFALLASVLARKRLKDPHSGQRVYSREMLEQFDWDYEDLAFTVDLLYWPALADYKISEVPIAYFERIGETTLTPLHGAIATLRRLFRRGRPKLRVRPPLN